MSRINKIFSTVTYAVCLNRVEYYLHFHIYGFNDATAMKETVITDKQGNNVKDLAIVEDILQLYHSIH